MTEKLNQAKVAIIGIPFDEYSSFMKGTSSAPALIRQAFHSPSSNLWSETGINLDNESLIVDSGDIDLAAAGDPLAAIENSLVKLLDDNFLPISLGGDHSITYPIIRAFHQKYDRLSILQCDAHPDLYEEFQGNRFSHACPFARIMEQKLARRLVQVGIRTMNAQQLQQAEKFGVTVIQMKDWSDRITLEFQYPLYISIDLDALDPAFVPGVSHYEPGGMTTREIISLIHRIKAPVIIGADIVEFNPWRDLNGLTAMTAAKILKELTGKMLI